MARTQQTNPKTNRTTTRKAPMKKQAARTSTTNAKRRSDTTSPSSGGADASNRMAEATGAPRQAQARKQGPKTGGKRKTARAEEGERPAKRPAKLRPIRTRQNRADLIATVAAASGIASPIVERVARSLSQTLTRHLIRNGSGRVEIPYLGAVLWRGRQAATKPRKMASPILDGRIVNVPGRLAKAVPRLRAHRPLLDAVARR